MLGMCPRDVCDVLKWSSIIARNYTGAEFVSRLPWCPAFTRKVSHRGPFLKHATLV